MNESQVAGADSALGRPNLTGARLTGSAPGTAVMSRQGSVEVSDAGYPESEGEASKRCSSCKILKPLSEYAINKTKRDGRQTVCKACKKIYNGSHTRKATYKAKYYPAAYERRNRQIEKNRRKLWAYLRTHPCVDCGETDIVVLDFDHQRDKVQNVSVMVAKGWSWAKIESEIAKCEVVCANDHRRRTARTQKWYKGTDLAG
jgi:hypothetical protein